MKGINIFFYSLSSLSLIITSLILFFAFKQKIYRLFINKFMIFILVSEIISMAAQYLSLTRNKCFEDLTNITNACRTPNMASNIQMILEILSEMWTIASALVIALKINDSFSESTKLFERKSVQRLTQIGILVFSAVFSLVLGLIQQFYYQKNFETRNVATGKCLVMNCHLANNLVSVQVVVMLFLIFTLLGISIKNHCYLNNKAKKLTFDMDVIFHQTEASKQIKKTLNKIIIVPLTTLIIYLFLFFDRTCKVFLKNIDQNFNSSFFTVTGIIFGVINGLKGIIFSVVIVFIVTDLKDSLLSCLKKEEQSEPNEDQIQNLSIPSDD